jgi:hypothetical protein
MGRLVIRMSDKAQSKTADLPTSFPPHVWSALQVWKEAYSRSYQAATLASTTNNVTNPANMLHLGRRNISLRLIELTATQTTPPLLKQALLRIGEFYSLHEASRSLAKDLAATPGHNQRASLSR